MLYLVEHKNFYNLVIRLNSNTFQKDSNHCFSVPIDDELARSVKCGNGTFAGEATLSKKFLLCLFGSFLKRGAVLCFQIGSFSDSGLIYRKANRKFFKKRGHSSKCFSSFQQANLAAFSRITFQQIQQ